MGKISDYKYVRESLTREFVHKCSKSHLYKRFVFPLSRWDPQQQHFHNFKLTLQPQKTTAFWARAHYRPGTNVVWRSFHTGHEQQAAVPGAESVGRDFKNAP